MRAVIKRNLAPSATGNGDLLACLCAGRRIEYAHSCRIAVVDSATPTGRRRPAQQASRAETYRGLETIPGRVRRDQTRTKLRTNDARSRQTQPDVPRHQSRPDLR